MEKIIDKKFKKAALTTTLAGTMLLAACGSTKEPTKDNKNQNTEEPKQEVVMDETPVEELTQEELTEAQNEIISDENTYVIENYYNPAAELYNNNVDFFSSSIVGNGMAYADEAAPDGINIERIEDVVRTIKGDVADITPSRVVTARNNIEFMLLPAYLVKKTNFSQMPEDVLNEEQKEILKVQIPEIAKLSTLATDEETIQFVSKYEDLVDQVIADYNRVDENGNIANCITDSTKEMLANAIYEMMGSYTKDLNYMNNDSSSLGNVILLNATKLKLISLYVTVTGEPTLGDYVLAPRTYDEITACDLYNNENTRETMTERDKEIYNNYQSLFIGKAFEDYLCSAVNQLAGYANDNDDVHSKNDEIKQLYATKRYLLENYKQYYDYEYNSVNKIFS